MTWRPQRSDEGRQPGAAPRNDVPAKNFHGVGFEDPHIPAPIRDIILVASRPRLGDSDALLLSWLSLFSLVFFSYVFCLFLLCILSVLSYADIVKLLTCKRNASHERSDTP